MPILLALALVAAPAPKPPSVAKDTGQVLITPGDAGFIHRLPDPGFKPTVAYQWLDIAARGLGPRRRSQQPAPDHPLAHHGGHAHRHVRRLGRLRRQGRRARASAASSVARPRSAPRPTRRRRSRTRRTATLLFVYPDDAAFIAGKLKALGYDPADASTDPKTPAGVGNAVARGAHRVPHARRRQPARRREGRHRQALRRLHRLQAGQHAGPRGRRHRWQPIPFSDEQGGTISPGFLTPLWGQVRPFVLTRGDQFRPPPPPKWGSRASSSATSRRWWTWAGTSPSSRRRWWSSCARVRTPRGSQATGCSSRRTSRAAITRPRPGREALLRRLQRGDGRLHRVLGVEALLRHLAALLVGAHDLQG